MSAFRLDAVFPVNQSPAQIWDAIHSRISPAHIGSEPFEINGRDSRLEEIASLVPKLNEPSFTIRGARSEFHFSALEQYEISTLVVESDSLLEPDVDSWVAELALTGELRQAWISDTEYNRWQNATDPLQYEVVGKSTASLQLIEDKDLNYTFVDISKNPGRRILRSGYVEVVGSTMWFGDGFWRFSNAKLDEVFSIDWIVASKTPEGLVKISVTDDCFSSDRGRSAQLQERMRSFLYVLEQNSKRSTGWWQLFSKA